MSSDSSGQALDTHTHTHKILGGKGVVVEQGSPSIGPYTFWTFERTGRDLLVPLATLTAAIKKGDLKVQGRSLCQQAHALSGLPSFAFVAMMHSQVFKPVDRMPPKADEGGGRGGKGKKGAGKSTSSSGKSASAGKTAAATPADDDVVCLGYHCYPTSLPSHPLYSDTPVPFKKCE
eukprot:6462714-Amphidinium_carterae.1